MPISRDDVLEALRPISDPDLGRSIVDLGFVKEVKIDGGDVAVTLELTTPACPIRDSFRDEARRRLEALPGVTAARVLLTAQVRPGPTARVEGMEGVKNVVAVASGKGGVGKSTAAVHLALALVETGAAVGLMDADIYGPSVPRLLGLTGIDARPTVRPDGRIAPVERRGLRVISMGLIAGDETPVVWRGPMATQAIRQFLSRVAWGDLDYLLIDLPPGTGDVQLTIAQAAALAGAVIVTTPQVAAVSVAARGLRMFEEVNVPILGILENMAGFVCGRCGATTEIFPGGGGARLAEAVGAPLLGRVPLDPALASACDRGAPLVGAGAPTASPAAEAYRAAARAVAARISTLGLGGTGPRAPRLHLGADGLGLAWADGRTATLPYRSLRAACCCAGCRSETTGERLIGLDDVPADVRIVDLVPVGLYAVQIVWSDGHSSGLYPYRYLEELAATPGPTPTR